MRAEAINLRPIFILGKERMKNPGFAKRILVLACLLTCQQAAFAADEILVKARQQLDSKNAKEAYTLLAPLQS